MRLRIEDGGPGPKDGAFSRRRSLFERHGHGLAIARRAIEGCGGELGLDRRRVVVEQGDGKILYGPPAEKA